MHLSNSQQTQRLAADHEDLHRLNRILGSVRGIVNSEGVARNPRIKWVFIITINSYSVQLEIGTPGQRVSVTIDTGSDMLWVNPKCSFYSSSQPSLCFGKVQYNTSASSTWRNLTKPFEQLYGIGGASGTFSTDRIGIYGSKTVLNDVQFGVATNSSNQNLGVLGVGWGSNLGYKSFIDELASQKVTNSKAFSLSLGSRDNNESAIIFGGVDTKKFSGPLTTKPILPPQRGETGDRYWIQLDSIGLSGGSYGTKTINKTSLPVIFDSGSTYHFLPDETNSQIALSLGGNGKISLNGGFQVPCDAQRSSATMDFKFGDMTIRVPLRESIIPTGGKCYVASLTQEPRFKGLNILGDNFLRSAYVVFDQDKRQISLAQSANCGRNEQAITTAGAADFFGECGGARKNVAVSTSNSLSVLWGLAVVAAMALCL
ncbi:uncharacterized protein JN550_004717 [Neoarthrinium moseri]|uniref:uncharacterized protein n=1 Tax=Neoarthrinium moseri TaxID=1658444 RepID=UPI001FDE766F|nr:uncharacterized protein JN550_004717 [Neoarthrinium moseri]KAI1871272.1 hypothetical protein JN550_004717 [Neoarthrinium moseri]